MHRLATRILNHRIATFLKHVPLRHLSMRYAVTEDSKSSPLLAFRAMAALLQGRVWCTKHASGGASMAGLSLLMAESSCHAQADSCHSALPPVGAVGKFLPFSKSISLNGSVPVQGRCCCFGSSSPYVVLKDRSYGNKQVISITPQLYEYILSNVREPEVKLCVLFLTFVSLACTMQCIYSSDLLVVKNFFLVADIGLRNLDLHLGMERRVCFFF